MRWRRATTAQLLVAWRAPQAAVRVALVAEHVPAAVGPCDQGWTHVRLLVDDDEVVEPRGRTVLDLLDDLARTLSAPAVVCLLGDWGERELVVVVPGQPPASARVPGLSSADEPSRSDWSRVLAALGNLAALGPVLTAATPPALSGRKDRTAAAMTDFRHRAVAHAAGLPAALFEPGSVAGEGIEREVALGRRIDLADVEMLAGALRVPLQAARLGDVTVVATDPIEGRQVTPLAAGLSSGRRGALLLWRQADARGYQVLRRGEVLDAHVWDRGWEVVELDRELDPELRENLVAALLPGTGEAEILVKHLAADADVDVVSVRSLLRRSPDETVLARLCELVGIDPRIAEVVEGSAEFGQLPGAQRVEAASGAAAMWAAARAPREDEPRILRASRRKPWWWRLADLVWVLACVLWIADLWPDGGGLARAGALLLAVTAVWSLYDAVTPAQEQARASVHEVDEDSGVR